jgi:hypothetical protein
MRMTAQYEDGVMYATFYLPDHGMTIVLGKHMTVWAIQNHLKEYAEWIG